MQDGFLFLFSQQFFSLTLNSLFKMSNYAAMVLAKGQALVTAKYQGPEQRRQIPTVMGLALKNQSISIPNAQELRTSPLRPVEINYFTNIAPGTGTAKAYNHTGSIGDAANIQLTYVTHVESFSIPQKIAYNSMATYQQIFANLYEMHWKNLRTRHDNSALAFLYANRVQLSAGVINPQLAAANPGTWNDINKALEISQADKPLFIQRVKSAMAARFMGGELDIVADLQLAALFDYASQQGAGNMANTMYQFDGTTISATQTLIDPNYTQGTVLAMQRGMFAGLNWNEGLNKTGLNEDKGGPVGTLGTTLDPLGSGAIADISMYTQRADTSANTYGGSTQDIVDQYELSLTIGYALPPLATSNDSVVLEASLVA
jgi:hypothetical protein